MYILTSTYIYIYGHMSHMLVNAGHMVQDVGTMWKKPATKPPVQTPPGRSLHRLPGSAKKGLEKPTEKRKKLWISCRKI